MVNKEKDAKIYLVFNNYPESLTFNRCMFHNLLIDFSNTEECKIVANEINTYRIYETTDKIFDLLNKNNINYIEVFYINLYKGQPLNCFFDFNYRKNYFRGCCIWVVDEIDTPFYTQKEEILELTCKSNEEIIKLNSKSIKEIIDLLNNTLSNDTFINYFESCSSNLIKVNYESDIYYNKKDLSLIRSYIRVRLKKYFKNKNIIFSIKKYKNPEEIEKKKRKFEETKAKNKKIKYLKEEFDFILKEYFNNEEYKHKEEVNQLLQIIDKIKS